MSKIFIQSSTFKDEIINKSKDVLNFEDSPANEAQIIISDDLSVFNGSNGESVKLFIGDISENLIDEYFKTIEKTEINGFFVKSDFLPDLISDELKRIANNYTYRGLASFSGNEKPIYFDTISKTENIGEEIDNIYIFLKEHLGDKIDENILRNTLTSQLLLTFSFRVNDPTNKIDIEFYPEDSRLLISTSTSTSNCELKDVLSLITESRSLCRNFLEDPNTTSITFSKDVFKILSIINYEEKNPHGLTIYSSIEKEQDIKDQREKDSDKYINFSTYLEEKKTKEEAEDSNIIARAGIISGLFNNVKLAAPLPSVQEVQAAGQPPQEASEDDKLLEDEKYLTIDKEMSQTLNISKDFTSVLNSEMDDKAKLKEIEKMMTALEVANKRLARLSENYSELVSENAELKQLIQEEKRQSTLDSNMQQTSLLQVDKLRDEVEELQDQRRKILQEVEKVKEETTDKDDELKRNVMALKLSKAEKEKLDQYIGTLEKRYFDSRARERLAFDDKKKALDKIKKQKTKIHMIESNLQTETEKKLLAENKAKSMVDKVKYMEKSTVMIKADIKEMNTEIVELEEENEKLKAVTAELKKRLAAGAKEAQNGANKSKAGSGNNAKAQKDLEAKFRKNEIELQKCKTIIVNTEKSKKTLERQLKDAKDKINEVTKRLATEKSTRIKAENENRALQRKVQNLEKK